jgi:serine/threonine-protein kinase
VSEDFARLAAALADRYRIERELGQGGMATVYLAHDLKHEREVAIKVLHPDLGVALGADRFLTEIRTTARLQHPHILPLLDSGEADGLLYYVMPLASGETLRARILRERHLPVEDAVRIACEVADALGYAHALGVIHRDIKPENIMLHNGHAVLSDFGVALQTQAETAARLTHSGVVLGTPLYMSPEHAAGERSLDGRSDLYELACVLYEALAGEPPFHGATVESLVRQHLTIAAPPITNLRPAVPPHVARALARALAKNPADRFADSASFARALREGSSSARRRIGRPALLVLAVATVMVVAGLVATLSRRTGNGAASGVDPHSIAVLAFDNVNADSGTDYFSDGLSDELRTALQRLPGLSVAARSSTLRFKESRLGAREIGESLHVATVLEGSVRRNGMRLRITPTLTNVATGYGVWSDQFDRTLSDVFALEEEVARGIVLKIAPQLLPEHGQTIMRQGTTDPEAYDLYLRGRHALGFRSGPEFEKAAAFFQEAIHRDPMFARAHAGLADAYCIQANFRYRLSKDVCPKSRDEANRALALDSTLAEAHATLGFVHLFYDWDLGAAERELFHAIALDSTYASAYLWLMHVSRIRHEDAEALARVRRAVALDSSQIMRSRLGVMLSQAGRHAEAFAEFERLLHADSTYEDAQYQLGVAYLNAQDYDRALAWCRAHGFQDLVALAYAGLGRATEARAIAAQLAASPDARLSSIDLSYIYAALDDRAAAMKWLEQAYEDRVPDVVFIRSSPRFATLKGFGPFEALARKVGVP